MLPLCTVSVSVVTMTKREYGRQFQILRRMLDSNYAAVTTGRKTLEVLLWRQWFPFLFTILVIPDLLCMPLLLCIVAFRPFSTWFLRHS